jgi:hypothetical protein
MTTNPLDLIKHQLVDENPDISSSTLQEMNLEQILAYVDAESTNTTESILAFAEELKK